jgi:Icc-related predicted phosphoesterase
MNIVVMSDFHNDVENIMNYIDKIALFDFDLVVCPGDFTDVTIPKGFTKIDIGELIIEELSSLRKPLLAVPGNQDREIIPLLEEKGISLHGDGKIIKDIGFYGFGGAKTPFGTSLEPEENEIMRGLEKGFEKIKNTKTKVQITHIPPARTKIDLLYSGAHAGSEVVRKFIEEKKPLVAISAHIHEARGVDELNGTKLINSGRFPEGYCGFVSIENDEAKVKIINLI